MAGSARVAVLATHPIHYQIQLYKRLARVPGMDVTMLFCSRFGLTRQIDHTFGVVHQWYDESILDGCKHKFLTNYSWERSPRTVFGMISPGVLREVNLARYDVLLVQGYAGITEWLAIAAARLGSCRVLFRGEAVLRPRSPKARAAVRWALMQALAKAVDVFLPIGTRGRDFYLHYGIHPGRLVLSPYAVNNDFFFAKARELRSRRAEFRQSLGIPDGVPVVLYVSKMTPRKRPMDLLKAFAALDAPAALVFVGDGPLRPEVESFAARQKLRYVFYVGFQRQEDLPRFYAMGDVFVLPSEDEPWGLVVNEAMCFALPIITTDGVACSADLVVHEGNGLLYGAGNTKALRDALRKLVSDPQQRLDMGLRSREIIRKWDQKASVDGICRAISMTMASSRPNHGHLLPLRDTGYDR